MGSKSKRQVQDLLLKGNITSFREILVTPNEILQRLGLSGEEISKVKLEAAQNVGDNPVAVSDLLEQPEKWCHVSFGCSALDDITDGGIYTRGITEICGESGAGKTQILLQLSLMVQLPMNLGGLKKKAVFICTEGQFPVQRLVQMGKYISPTCSNLDIKFTENIFIEHSFEVDDFVNCVSERLPRLVASKDVGMIIIDSIAGVFRSESNFAVRAEKIQKVGYTLNSLAVVHKCAIVCSNQVASVIDSPSTNKHIPCLGLSWASLVRTRLQVSKIQNLNITCDSVRKMEVIFAPDLPNKSAYYAIRTEGVTNERREA